MDTQTAAVSELRTRLIEKATTDEAFRAHLIADPKAAIKDGLGLTIPPGFNINVMEDTSDTSHLVLPPSARLDELDLSQAAGAGGCIWWNDNDD